MANPQQQENMLLTEHFSWPPIVPNPPSPNPPPHTPNTLVHRA